MLHSLQFYELSDDEYEKITNELIGEIRKKF
jgi:hypothetical protein